MSVLVRVSVSIFAPPTPPRLPLHIPPSLLPTPVYVAIKHAAVAAANICALAAAEAAGRTATLKKYVPQAKNMAMLPIGDYVP